MLSARMLSQFAFHCCPYKSHRFHWATGGTYLLNWTCHFVLRTCHATLLSTALLRMSQITVHRSVVGRGNQLDRKFKGSAGFEAKTRNEVTVRGRVHHNYNFYRRPFNPIWILELYSCRCFHSSIFLEVTLSLKTPLLRRALSIIEDVGPFRTIPLPTHYSKQ